MDASISGTYHTGVDVAARTRRLARVGRIARVMDTAIRIPVVGVRLGADSVMGLVPVIGDAAGGIVGLVMLNEARKLGLPKHKMLQMVGNIVLDAAVGSVPLIGDVFDVMFKSHQRNAALIFDHFAEPLDEGRRPAMRDITPKRS